MSTTTRPARWRKTLVAVAAAVPIAAWSLGSAGPVSAAPLAPAVAMSATSTTPTPSSSSSSGSATSLGESNGSNGKAPNVTFGVQPASPNGASARAYFDLLLDRGSVNRDNLRVTNYSEKPLLLHVYAADASNALDGGFVVADHGATPQDIAKWVTIGGLATGGTLRLAARTQIDLPIVVTVPLSAQPGDHAGALVVGYDTVSKDAKGDSVQVENRVASRLYARVSGVARAGVEVTDLAAHYHQSWWPWGPGQVRTTFVLHNTGNVRESITSMLRMSGVLGTAGVARALGGPGDVLPGGSVHIAVPAQDIRPALRIGVTVDSHAVEVPFGPGQPPPVIANGTAHVTVTAVPWAALAAIALLALLARAVVLWRRRPRKSGRHGGRQPRPTEDVASTIFLDPSEPSVITLPPVDELSPTGSRPPLTRSARRRGLSAGLIAVILVAGPTLAILGAHAAPASASAHRLYFAPAVGTSFTPAYVVTDSGCPASSSNIVARAYGHGFPASGQAVVSNSTSGISHSTPFIIPLQDTMSSFAQQNRTKLVGSYRITLICTDRLLQHSTIAFSGSMHFNAKLHYTAPPPPAQVVAAVNGAESAPQGSTTPQQLQTPTAAPTKSGAGATSPAPGHSSSASGSSTPGATAQAGGSLADQPVSQTTTASSTHQTGLIFGAGIGGLLVLFSAGWLIHDHRRNQRIDSRGNGRDHT